MSKLIPFLQFFTLFLMSSSVAQWGFYSNLKYPNLTMVEAFMHAIPYGWLDWFLMSFATEINHKNKLLTPTQITLVIIVTQFTLVLLINKFYLKKKVSFSDIIAFFIILAGFGISLSHGISVIMGIPVPKMDKKES